MLLNGAPTHTYPHPPLDLQTHIHTKYVTHPCPISLTYPDLLPFAHPCPYLPKLAHTHLHPLLDLQAQAHPPARYVTHPCPIPTHTNPHQHLDLNAYPHPPTRHITYPSPISLTHTDMPNLCPYMPKLDNANPHPPLDLHTYSHPPANYPSPPDWSDAAKPAYICSPLPIYAQTCPHPPTPTHNRIYNCTHTDTHPLKYHPSLPDQSDQSIPALICPSLPICPNLPTTTHIHT